MIIKVFTTHLDQNLIVKMIKIRIKKSIDNNIDTKLPNVFDYWKGLSQDANKLMDEIKEADNNIDKRKLIFLGSNREKFNFNIFRMLVDFLSAIYNGEISSKEAQISQRKMKEKIEELRGYRPENPEQEISGVLMQANDMLEYRNKIIEAFRNGTFLSKHLKKIR